MLDILSFLFKTLKIRAPIIMAILLGIALTITYQQYRVNAYQDKCISDLKENLSKTENNLTYQKEIQVETTKAIENYRKDSKRDLILLDRKINTILFHITGVQPSNNITPDPNSPN